MFTGIIEDIGKIVGKRTLSNGLELTFSTPKLHTQLKIGDSISINGACSTITQIADTTFVVQYSEETLSKTTFSKSKIGEKVNLELSLLPTSRIGGHFVTGHIDELGKIQQIHLQNDFGKINISISPQNKMLVVPKGSITMNGISLTVSTIQDLTLTCYIIPHTFKNTSLLDIKSGDLVHLEYDILGKYIYQFYSQTTNSNPQSDSTIMNQLMKAGFIND